MTFPLRPPWKVRPQSKCKSVVQGRFLQIRHCCWHRVLPHLRNAGAAAPDERGNEAGFIAARMVVFIRDKAGMVFILAATVFAR